MLEAHLGEKHRAAAAEGWDGDRVVSYQGSDGAIGVVWMSRWDTPADATEFAEAYAAGLPYKWDTLKQEPKSSLIQVCGDRVLVVDGFPEGVAGKIAEAVWAGATFVPDGRDASDKELPEKATGPIVTVETKTPVATEKRKPTEEPTPEKE